MLPPAELRSMTVPPGKGDPARQIRHNLQYYVNPRLYFSRKILRTATHRRAPVSRLNDAGNSRSLARNHYRQRYGCQKHPPPPPRPGSSIMHPATDTVMAASRTKLINLRI
jgi:hypothetical protein